MTNIRTDILTDGRVDGHETDPKLNRKAFTQNNDQRKDSQTDRRDGRIDRQETDLKLD